MTPKQIEYIRKNWRVKSAKELARFLNTSPRAVQAEIQKLSQVPAPVSSAAPAPRAVPPARTPAFPWVHAACVLFAAVFVFAVYSRTLSYPFLNWDDPRYVTENRLIRSLSADNLKEMFTRPHFSLYIPLTLVSYAADYQLSHFNPSGYHWTSLLLHLANTVMVYALVVFVCGDWLTGLAAALLFGIHPVQIESVVWISERKNVLSSFFFLPAAGAYIAASRSPRRGALLALSFACFIAACFAKPNVVVLPLLLAAYDLSSGAFDRKKIFRYLLYLAGAFLFALITYRITRLEGKMTYHGGSLGTSLLTMSVVMMKYLELLALPVRQSLLYAFPVYTSAAHPKVALSLAGLALLAAGLAWLWKKDRRNFFWGAWYFILLLPVMNIVPFPSLMNDRYLYLPLIGAAALFFSLLGKFAGRPAVIALLVLCTAGYSGVNLRRQAVWADTSLLWLETQRQTEGRGLAPSLAAYVNLGDQYLQDGEIDKAMEQFRKALTQGNEPMAYGGLGLCYLEKKDFEKAAEYFKKGLIFAPRAATLHNNLAFTYESMRQYDLALESYRKAASFAPRDAQYVSHLADLLLTLGRKREAEEAFQKALNVDPDYADALYNLGSLYFAEGKAGEARKLWSRLLAVHPGYERARFVTEKLREIKE